MEILKSVFRAYDIRGKYPNEINEEFAYLLGRAFVLFLMEKKNIPVKAILVNRDARFESKALQESLVRGLIDGGVVVFDGGIGTTPMHYFGIGTFDVDAGIMVTPSHGPVGTTGFKISTKTERIASETGLPEIYERMSAPFSLPKTRGVVKEFVMLPRYIRFLMQFIKVSPFGTMPRVVIDAAGGAAVIVLKELLTQIRVDARKLFFDLDPVFSRHSPNPLDVESQASVVAELKKNHQDFGVIFDGDGDRAIFFDEFGEIMQPDVVGALIAEEKLKYIPHKVTLFDVNSSKKSREYVQSKHGYVEVVRVGTAFFRNRLQRDQGIILGAESSGHYYYPEFFNSDAAILTFIYMLNLRAGTQKRMSDLASPMRTTFRSGEINFIVQNKDVLTAEILARFKSAKISTLDGLSVEYPTWWFSLRASNTEPLVRLHIEADTKELLQEKVSELENIVRAF